MTAEPRPELLAPAGCLEALTAAVRCGADAVYIGAKQFSARNHAENFDKDTMREAAARCHLNGVKLYLAVNTLLLDQEFDALDRLLEDAAMVGLDGAIVQDLGVASYIRRRLPTLRLHASTQMTVHSPAGIRFAGRAGFRRVVLARELSQEQLRICCNEAQNCHIETEVFVHGAHCMCVSGQCLLSAAMGGRSANRGCCAQPCRLPFAAEGGAPDAYALSLKDLSLLPHLAEIRALGVRSLKIEGRMKRPEYVAAAVTACRAVLDGKEPDLGTLRAVFSRSGFTDGYFTGKRQEMFGIRRKEDVTAAQDVLGDLRKLYGKPRKAAVLDAVFILRSGEPARLTVTDRSGRSVTVTGEIPQTARSRPTDLAQLQKQFEKLGDTVYTAGEVRAELDGGLMLPASVLNDLRRSAAAKMDALRIAAHTPEHRIADLPEKPAAEPRVSAHSTRLQIRRLEQLSMLDPAHLPDVLLLPLPLLNSFMKSPYAVWFPPERCQLLMPRFLCDEAALKRRLIAAAAAGFRQIACRSVGDLALGRELGLTLHASLGIHITNGETAHFLRQYPVADGLVSPEISGQHTSKGDLPVGMFAYGRLPLMLMRVCPVQASVGCAMCRHHLTDRRGASLYADCTRDFESPDYTELFNSAAVWLADRPETYRRFAYSLLSMTDESPERVRDVVAAYMEGAPCTAPEPFTRGIRLAKDDPRAD